jgi:exonuclease SbcD
MRKILHTADWHVDKTIGRSTARISEMRQVLGEIAALAEEEAVDLLLMAGDVFDRKVPTPEAEALVYETFLRLERAGIPVVLIPGNHDHPERWRAIRPLFERFSVHVVPEPAPANRGGIVRIAPPRGGAPIEIATLPWVPLRRIVPGEALINPHAGQGYIHYEARMTAMMSALAGALDPDACTMLAGHMYISGAKPGGGERELTLGDTYAVDPQNVPQVQYFALGHVHRPQAIRNCPVPARYAGSPLQLDFGELGYQNSVSVVELEPGLPAQVREVPITGGRRLLDVHGSLDELEAMRDELGDAFLRVTLRCEKPQPGLGERVREVLENALEVILDYPRETTAEREVQVRSLGDRDKYARYLRERYNTDPEPADLLLFEELLAHVQDSRR